MSTQHNVDNLSQWTSRNFEELKKILHDLILHIRWFQIPSKDFWRKVSPFEQIFPKQLYKDIMGYYCDPDTPPTNKILPSRRNLVYSDKTWQQTPDSFLFSFTKKEEIDSALITRVTNNSNNRYAVSYSSSNYGPAFGSGWDLIIRNDNIRSNGYSTYPGINSFIVL